MGWGDIGRDKFPPPSPHSAGPVSHIYRVASYFNIIIKVCKCGTKFILLQTSNRKAAIFLRNIQTFEKNEKKMACNRNTYGSLFYLVTDNFKEILVEDSQQFKNATFSALKILFDLKEPFNA